MLSGKEMGNNMRTCKLKRGQFAPTAVSHAANMVQIKQTMQVGVCRSALLCGPIQNLIQPLQLYRQ